MGKHSFRRLLSLVVLAIPFACYSQEAEQEDIDANGLRPGDILCVNPMVSRSLYDLSDSEIADETYLKLIHQIGKDSISVYFQQMQKHYVQDDQSLRMIGLESNQTLINYELPEECLHYPIQTADSLSSYFSGGGIFGDKAFVRHYGYSKTKSEALPYLVLPEGDTIKEAIKVVSNRYYGLQQYPVDTLLKEVPVYDVDSVKVHLGTDAILYLEQTARVYVNGFRYPVVEQTTICNADDVTKVYSNKMFFCDPNDQILLVEDVENGEIQIVEKQEETVPEGYWTSDVQDITSLVRNDKDRKEFVLEYSSYEQTSGALLLADVNSFVVEQCYFNNPPGENYSVALPYGHLRNATYFLYVRINDSIYNLSVNFAK